MLQLTSVSKAYNNITVLEIQDCSLSQGLYWLQGHNGSGKSTLLKIIAGLIPFSGNITLNNSISLHKQPVLFKKSVNYAPAEPLFPPFVTGQELVNFVQKIKSGTTKQITTVCDALQIGDFINNPTGTYSSGMLKKLSLLLAFTGEHQWILLDEPFTTLDKSSQEALEQLVVHTHKQENVSFILTSHHEIEATHIPFTKTFAINNKNLTVVNTPHAG